MRNRSTRIFPFVLAGLLLTTAQRSHAQQPSSTDLSNREAAIKCRTPVTVTGAVVAPSRVELRRRVRLNELLALTGGFTEQAGKTVEIRRAAPGFNCDKPALDNSNKEPGSVEIYDLTELKRGSESANPYLQPGDHVIVSEVGVAYVMGNVARPQPIILKEATTVTQAIAMAGGVLPNSTFNRVRILRGCNPAMEVIVVDLKAVEKGRVADVLVQPYDIVFVPGKRAYLGPPLCRSNIPRAIETPLRVIY